VGPGHAKQHFARKIIFRAGSGQAKSYYCIASTVLDINELKDALRKARQGSRGIGIKEKSKLMHSIIDEIAGRKNYFLKLRK